MQLYNGSRYSLNTYYLLIQNHAGSMFATMAIELVYDAIYRSNYIWFSFKGRKRHKLAKVARLVKNVS